MTPLTQFSLPFFDNFEIQGEYEGNDETGKVIIFSHGFGVKRNSRSMFDQISNHLKHDYLTIRFDYNKIIPDKNATYVFPLSLQAKMLEHVYTYATKTFSPFNYTLIAHSMGCIVASSLQLPQIDQTILLAPPITSQYERLKSYFSKRTGTVFNEDDITTIERSDGSFTYVPAEFWIEVNKVQPLNLYQTKNTNTSLFAIHPKQDQILSEEPYATLEKLLKEHYFEIEGNHEFSPPHRQKLLDTIQQILSEEP